MAAQPAEAIARSKLGPERGRVSRDTSTNCEHALRSEILLMVNGQSLIDTADVDAARDTLFGTFGRHSFEPERSGPHLRGRGAARLGA